MSQQCQIQMEENCIIQNTSGNINPNAAELFWTIFHSFGAGIANAISSSK